VYDVTNYLDDACSIRFVKDNDTLGGNIIDQDGNVYHPVKIGNQVWLQENWACTKFANGEAITKGLTDGESWYDYYEAVEANAFYLGAPVTSEVNDPNHIRPKEDDVTVKVEYIDPKVDFWEYESITIPDAIHFGSLYNHAACMDVRGIANVGFRLPTYTEMVNFKDFIGTNNGLDLRDTGAEYWDFNGGATNLHNFNSRGSGMRFEGGNFMLLKNFAAYWTDTENEYFPENAWLLSVNDSSGGVATVVVVNYSKKNASSIRLVKDVTTLANGESGTYTGNDGRVYPTICIDGVEYMAADLCETKFRDGSLIPNVSINAEWAALNSAGMCYYNNVQSNAYTLETIIPDATRIRPIGADVKLRSEYVVGGGAGGSVEYEQIITTTNGTADGDGVITGTVTFNLDPDIDTAKPIKVIDGSLFTKAYTINNAASPKTITMAVAPLAENDLTIYFYKI